MSVIKLGEEIKTVTITCDSTHLDQPTAVATVDDETLSISFTGLMGAQGEDGMSPTVTTAEVEGGTKVTFTDASGVPKEVIIKDGATGPAGPAGPQGPAGEIDWNTLKDGSDWDETFKTQLQAFMKEFYNLTAQGCFMAGTLIATPKGDIPIEKIKVGDIVYSYDFSTEEIVGREVLMTHTPQEEDVIKVTFSDGQELQVTKRHRFYEWDDKKWTKIGDFEIGDTIKTVDGDPITITAMEEISGTQQVYNLTVKEFSNFFVIPADASAEIWGGARRRCLVHNDYVGSVGAM